MPHVIRKFRNKHPDVEFEIHTGVLPLKHMLEENLVDIAICEKKIIDRPGWNPLLKDDVYVAVNCNSPFYDAESVDLKDLTTCEMVPSVISNNVVCDIFSKLNRQNKKKTGYIGICQPSVRKRMPGKCSAQANKSGYPERDGLLRIRCSRGEALHKKLFKDIEHNYIKL